MSRVDMTEDWILEDLAAITGKDIKELRKSKVKTKSTPVNRHKYFRRPGKRHNNDFCFSCREGGTLICCDGCTKSFHLLCLDPPMEDEDIPEGEWLCKTCKLGKKQTVDGVISLKFLSKKRKRSIEDDGSDDSKEAKLIRTIWSQLIRRAMESDPKEYENPLDCRTIPYIFPGDSKNTKKNQIKPKHPHSTKCYICGKGLAKQSMINCDYCERSFHLDCTDPPLTIPPKYFWMCQFHIEPCLERLFYQEELPSLSQRIALWDMCRKPIDQESIKLEFLRNAVEDPSKLVQLPTVPIDIPDAVYNHYNNRPDSIPSLKEALRLVGYDQSVHHLYKVPSLDKKLSLEYSKGKDKTSKEEQELWLATILGFQRDLVSKLNLESVARFPKDKSEEHAVEIVGESPPEEIEKEEIVLEENSNASETSSNSSKSSKATGKIKVKRPHDEITKVLETAIAELPEVDECLNIMNYLDEDFINILAFQRLSQLINYKKVHSKMVEHKKLFEKPLSADETKSLTNRDLETYVGIELEKTTKEDESSINMTDKLKESAETVIISDGEYFRKIEKDYLKSTIDVDSYVVSKSASCESLIKKEINSTVNSVEDVCDSDAPSNMLQIEEVKEENVGADLEKLDDDDDSNSKNNKKNRSKEFFDLPVVSDVKGKEITTMSDDSVCGATKIYGVLTAVDRQTQLFPIYKSGFIIGRGSSVHLDLSICGHCNFISNYHAVVYFDSRSHLWEIINYSRFGCRVNNVLVSFDVPKKALQNILRDDSDEETCPFHESVKSISKRQFALIDKEVIKSERADMLKSFYKNPCNCDPEEMNTNMSSSGWNNSVPFGHGSLLKFGCISLVFGDTSYVI